MIKPKWGHTMEELDMLNCLFYLNHSLYVVIGIKRGIALFIPGSSFSFYTLFFLVTYNDNRTARIVRAARALIASLDSIQNIEPRHLEKWVYAEANRRRKDLNP